MIEKVGIRVRFSPRNRKFFFNKIYNGTIHKIDNFGIEKEIFIKFDNIDEYLDIVSNGISIYVKNEKKIIYEIKKDSKSVIVCKVNLLEDILDKLSSKENTMNLSKDLSLDKENSHYEEISFSKIESVRISEYIFNIFTQDSMPMSKPLFLSKL